MYVSYRYDRANEASEDDEEGNENIETAESSGDLSLWRGDKVRDSEPMDSIPILVFSSQRYGARGEALIEPVCEVPEVGDSDSRKTFRVRTAGLTSLFLEEAI
jgi:hypothetical protein